MTLDETTSVREAMARQREADRAQQRADWEERCLLESVEAEEARWAYRFRLWAEEMPKVHYEDMPGVDRRVFAVDGEIPEQARRDAS